MRKVPFNNYLLMFLLAIPVTGCYDINGELSVRREIIDVGKTNVGDSVCASFTFKNNSTKEMTISFLPECDCTTINIDNMKLEPSECGLVEVKVAVDNPGDFIKYVYVQASGEEDFLTIAVKGHVK